MPSSDPPRRYRDILDNIARIERHTAGMTPETFVADDKTLDTVERCLSEAAVKLGDAAERRHPSLPWRDVRGLGNRLRHEYGGVDPVRIWYTIEDHLPPLKDACREALA